MFNHPIAQSRLLQVAVAAAVLCWAAIVNGQPFVFTDSQAYVRSVDVAVAKFLGQDYASPWLDLNAGAIDQRMKTEAEAQAEAGPVPAEVLGESYEDDEVIAGRSIYYGALTYLGQVTGGFWLTVLIQALAVAALIDITLNAMRLRSLAVYAVTIGILAIATPAPFYVGFLMPDIWTGVLIGAVATLVAYADRLSRAEFVLLSGGSVFAAMAHSTSILILVAAIGTLIVYLIASRGRSSNLKLALGVSGLALGAGVAGTLLFNAAVSMQFGNPPITPPFLTAKLQAYEPGLRFVKERCGDAQFEVCRFADRLPLETDSFLWSKDPATSVWQTTDPVTRRALSNEQYRFAFAVLGAYPVSQLASFVQNAAIQFVTVDLRDFVYDDQKRRELSDMVPDPHLTRMQRTLAWTEAWPLDALTAIQNGVYFASMAVILGLLGLRIGSQPGPSGSRGGGRIALYVSAVLLGVFFNAVICGDLSALHGRYQARVAWLLPLGAFALLLVSEIRVLRGAISRLTGANP